MPSVFILIAAPPRVRNVDSRLFSVAHNHQRRLQRRERRRERRHERRAAEYSRWGEERAVWRAGVLARWHVTQLTDPIEIVLAVLMMVGNLPEEMARMIVFDYRVLATPMTRVFRGDWGLRAAISMLDTWDGEPDYHTCTCTWDADYDSFGSRNASARFAASWRNGHRHPPAGIAQMTLNAACHTSTCYSWRGSEMTDTFYWMAETYGSNAQVWSPHFDSCGLTQLHYRLWLNRRGLPADRTPPIEPREFSFVRWLREAPMHELAWAIDLNMGDGCDNGRTREERIALMTGDFEWHSREWWHRDRCRRWREADLAEAAAAAAAAEAAPQN